MIGWLRAKGPHLQWVLADQVLVSGCNFLITILYARFLGPAAFGVYALITMAQQYFVSVSVSMIGNPLITSMPHLEEKERRHLVHRSFAAQLLVGFGLAFVAAAAMAALLLTESTSMSAVSVFGLAASSFGLPTLEWCRRLCFVHEDGRSLFRFDALAYLPIVIAALVLHSGDLLSLDYAVLLWGVTSVVASVVAIRHLHLPWRRIAGARTFLMTHWRASRDFVTSFQAQWIGSQGIVYLAAPVIGASGIGAYRSIAGLLGFVNAIGTTLDNVLPLRLATTYRQSGKAALRRKVERLGLLLTGIFLVLLLPFVVFSGEIVGLVLGDAYVAYAGILWVQLIYVGLMFANRLAIYHERAQLKTHGVAISAILGAVVSILVVVAATRALGPVGVACSCVAAGTTSLLYVCVSIARDAKKD